MTSRSRSAAACCDSPASDDLEQRVRKLERMQAALASAGDLGVRTPYFCSGCPHNTSTKVPDGMRAYAGIGCHYMVQWMDRSTEGFTQMGGEGVNWIGEAPFSKRAHVFQNLGDGTYDHSGTLAIRFAVAAGVNITYKILFNDAVAMTGGQPLEGNLTVDMIARQVAAENVKRIVVRHRRAQQISGRHRNGRKGSPSRTATSSMACSANWPPFRASRC